VIQYTLNCDNDHKFEAWFRNAGACDEQVSRGIVSCPICSSSKVSKALMAPAVARDQEDKVTFSAGHPDQTELRRRLKDLRDKITAEAHYVGNRFAQEARKMHEGELEPHGIYGEATREEVSSLLEDGVDLVPLPNLPEEHN